MKRRLLLAAVAAPFMALLIYSALFKGRCFDAAYCGPAINDACSRTLAIDLVNITGEVIADCSLEEWALGVAVSPAVCKRSGATTAAQRWLEATGVQLIVRHGADVAAVLGGGKLAHWEGGRVWRVTRVCRLVQVDGGGVTTVRERITPEATLSWDPPPVAPRSDSGPSGRPQ